MIPDPGSPIPELISREVVVTYRCGHTETELSASEAEDAEHRRIAAMFDCVGCWVEKLHWRLAQQELRGKEPS